MKKAIIPMIVVLALGAGAALADPGPPVLPCIAGNDRVFEDVPADHLFCPWIEELWQRGATAGCGDGNYCPGETLTRGQAAPFILKSGLSRDPWVRINADGEVVESSGVLDVIHSSESGQYGIYFDRNIDDCAVVGTINISTLLSHVTVQKFVRAPIVTVTTWSASGIPDDRPFSVILRCPLAAE